MTDPSRSLPDVLTSANRDRFGPPGRRPMRREAGIASLVLLAIVLVAAMAFALWRYGTTPPRHIARPAPVVLPGGIVIPIDEPLPAVVPVVLKAIAPDDARAANAAVPFWTGPNPRARGFALTGGPVDVARATDCLAAAAIYEAGDDAQGQRAVAQVVLNRVRHPAFPHTVCGVIFQGSERRTGCQFSFTCDGSMARHHPGPAVWARARVIAGAALGGSVFAQVGLATHYHTDWVVPYWSANLVKLTAVKTHLFFRWAGGWGTPRAFVVPYGGVEPLVGKLAGISDAHKPTSAADAAAMIAPADPLAPTAAADGTGMAVEAVPQPTAGNPNVFLVALDPALSRDRYAEVAARACGARPRCVFMGWLGGRNMPTALPASTSQLQTMEFHYLRDPAFQVPRMRWNCAAMRRDDPAECLSHQAAPVPANSPTPEPK